jgi:mannose-1-phosphate guanylyltransferase / phosphomannomutase
MKAVIMAGGKGTRLRPLTCNKPKPMVPLLNRPCMEYTIDLLKRYGIREIAVTLQYLPKVIRDHFGDGSDFGVQIEYFEEAFPLGTAGSVKNAESFLDDTFLVISGDALTDFDLQAAIDAHHAKGAIGTIVLTRVETPLEYGVVITRENGEIERFLEKPSWGEVFSDTVNTGIYIFDRSVLDSIPQDTEFDFSKDLFPLLMKRRQPLYGYIASGYWSDIGNLQQYRQTQFDMLDGKVKIQIAGQEIHPRVWVGKDVQLAEQVRLEGPVYIGDRSVIAEKVELGPYTVIGENNWIQTGASLRRSVIWNQNYMERGAELRGATIASQVYCGAHSSFFEGAVVGDECTVGHKSIIKPNVKVWPNKQIQESTIVHTSLIWSEKLEKRLFAERGVSGICNVDITPDFAGRLAAAFGATLQFGARIAVSADAHPFSQLIKRAFMSGLQSAGVHTLDVGEMTTPVLRHAIRRLHADGGIHVRQIDQPAYNRVLIEFLDKNGMNIEKSSERKIENAYWQEDFRRANASQIGTEEHIPHLKDAYLYALLNAVNSDPIRKKRFKMVVQYDQRNLSGIVPDFMEKLGCRVLSVQLDDAAKGELSVLVAANQADLGVRIDKNGERIILVTEDGYVIEEDVMMVMQVLVCLQSGRKSKIAVPVSAPSIMEDLVARWKGEIIRTKANPRALMEPCVDEPFFLFYDALYTLALVLEHMAVQEKKLSQILSMIPDFHMLCKQVPCAWEDKGKVMRRLIEETKGEHVELVDGIKIHHSYGWTLVLPDSDAPAFRVFTQAESEKAAEELAAAYAMKIHAYQSEAKNR